MKFDSTSYKQFSEKEIAVMIDEYFGISEETTLQKNNKINRKKLIIDFTPPAQTIPTKYKAEGER